ncbi:immunoglobulin-like domain-containing protein [Haloprofundus halobius]|uniref:immunoglobulin-like domain-containing protein n=1 Tax=Haloprofundus halobius TaxID=2876194 RepID=UPI001CCD6189|nr:immunoglobulin-like domain-containing protein [Haloprofundus halobius]
MRNRREVIVLAGSLCTTCGCIGTNNTEKSSANNSSSEDPRTDRNATISPNPDSTTSSEEPTFKSEPQISSFEDERSDTSSCSQKIPLNKYLGDMSIRHSDDSVNGVVLKSSHETLQIGEEIRLSLINNTKERKEFGSYNKINIEIFDEEEWLNIFHIHEGFGFTDELYRIKPGSGFQWHFTVSQPGFSKGPFTVCSELIPGEYRFTYWGLNEKKSPAVQFTVE